LIDGSVEQRTLRQSASIVNRRIVGEASYVFTRLHRLGPFGEKGEGIMFSDQRYWPPVEGVLEVLERRAAEIGLTTEEVVALLDCHLGVSELAEYVEAVRSNRLH
jgi:hypothetical protein